ncbi:hypothetical protein [uncultured Paraglaciecola sp.]|uniref:hypothetical protein n=1 Tax=uncultured Paraglaciecola sp. TaxID=1765024 RepID=UPI00262E4B88|nr:hypothetical protein [uncultured Paraglaciecola sp.]
MKSQFSPLTAQNSDPYFDLHKQGQFSPWSRKIFEDCLTKPYFAYSLNQYNQPLGYYIGMTVLDEVTLMGHCGQRCASRQGFRAILVATLYGTMQPK